PSTFNNHSPTAIYNLSLHDALPIYTKQVAENKNTQEQPTAQENVQSQEPVQSREQQPVQQEQSPTVEEQQNSDGHTYHYDPEYEDRKSTRLNSSHVSISYAVFCLKK